MAHQISIQPTGERFACEPGQSILEAAEAAGVEIPYGCQSGSCGACMARMAEGEVDYPETQPLALTPAEEEAGQVLTCVAHPASDLVLDFGDERQPAEIAPRILPTRVQSLERLAPDVMQILLRLPRGESLAFHPGQYVDILLDDGRRRAFSLANTPGDAGLLELHVRHVPGGAFTDRVFEALEEGAMLRIEGPLGQFHLHEDSGRPMIMVAGGTGFAPIKGIIEHALDLGFEWPIHLFWGVRARRDLYLGELAAQWAEDFDHVEFTPVLSAPRPDDDWQGETGYVHEALLRRYPDLSGFDIYTAGPPVMVDAVRRGCLAAGADAGHVFADAFEFAAETRRARGD